jgi:RNA polymerase sigma-70 factor (ECF subfamily)
VTVDDDKALLADRFESNRAHLRGVAYRMLGSVSEADDAVQEAWLRLNRTDTAAVENLRGWLTTVVARVCLDILRTRRSRREEPFEGHVPEPVITAWGAADPEHEAVLADSVGLAMLVVLERLAPAERLAFVLHDMFAVPFDEIAPLVGRTPTAARQLASRARRRVQGSAPVADPDLGEQRRVVDAFVAASRAGDMAALVAVLDPEVVLRVDSGPGHAETLEARGAETVAARARRFAGLAPFARRALVNGAPGAVVVPRGRPYAVLAFTVAGGRIVELDVLVDPARIARLDVSAVEA